LQPGIEVLDLFEVRLIAPLGGRLNQHWLVESGAERLVLRCWARSGDDVEYEVRLLAGIARLGWPVAPAVAGPIVVDGKTWSLFPFLPGDPPVHENPAVEQRARGRLLAEFHASVGALGGFGQRIGWRRCEEILAGETLDRILGEHEVTHAEEVEILRWHLGRARTRIDGLDLVERPGIVVHGDFTPWNLRFVNGKLSGILDFELAHCDHRVGDFSLSWRGKYDEMIRGYDEVSPLDDVEWELVTPQWWADLINNACQRLKNNTPDDGWIIRKLLDRSPLMGVDAEPYR